AADATAARNDPVPSSLLLSTVKTAAPDDVTVPTTSVATLAPHTATTVSPIPIRRRNPRRSRMVPPEPPPPACKPSGTDAVHAAMRSDRALHPGEGSPCVRPWIRRPWFGPSAA